jgi:hypothetical protein
VTQGSNLVGTTILVVLILIVVGGLVYFGTKLSRK